MPDLYEGNEGYWWRRLDEMQGQSAPLDTSSPEYAEALELITAYARFIVGSPQCFANSEVYDAKKFLGYDD